MSGQREKANFRERVLATTSVKQLKQRARKEDSWSALGAAKLVLVKRSTGDGPGGFFIVGQCLTDVFTDESPGQDSEHTLVTCRLGKDTKYTVSSPSFHYFDNTEQGGQVGAVFQHEEDAIRFSTQIVTVKDALAKAPQRASKRRERVTKRQLEEGRQASKMRRDSVDLTDVNLEQNLPSVRTYGEMSLSSSTILHRNTQPVSHGQKAAVENPLSSNITHVENDLVCTKSNELMISQAQLEKTTVTVGEDEKALDYQYVQFIPEKEALKQLSQSEVELPCPHYCTVVDEGSGKDKRNESNFKPCSGRSPKATKNQDVITQQPTKTVTVTRRHMCVFCHSWYTESDNQAGACKVAPSLAQSCVEKVTCYGCAEGIAYHCAADSEGDFRQPFSCSSDDPQCIRRWCCVCGFGLFVPCIFCNPPLKLCFKCGTQLHICGAKHRPR